MVFNITYKDNNIREEIDQLVGKPFSFLERFRKGGIGSRRMIILEASVNLQSFLSPDHYPTYSSIELRPKGILLYVNQGLKRFAWAIPFYQLVIYQSTNFTIHSKGDFIRYRATNDPVHHQFIRKLVAAKADNTSSVYPEH